MLTTILLLLPRTWTTLRLSLTKTEPYLQWLPSRGPSSLVRPPARVKSGLSVSSAARTLMTSLMSSQSPAALLLLRDVRWQSRLLRKTATSLVRPPAATKSGLSASNPTRTPMTFQMSSPRSAVLLLRDARWSRSPFPRTIAGPRSPLARTPSSPRLLRQPPLRPLAGLTSCLRASRTIARPVALRLRREGKRLSRSPFRGVLTSPRSLQTRAPTNRRPLRQYPLRLSAGSTWCLRASKPRKTVLLPVPSPSMSTDPRLLPARISGYPP
ncbi:hypothetical protein BZA05DRAFT_391785 [Tricharina praecox]|uniref:uncharacterized protein n=1 Tax=Tricharina praecox TaxID=43433 RepID=UPI00221F157F|nr:uncharacterized protein BZA05DRAFT_391785 [Tricharina praecox]KAI5855512.1 hypothetical protein BZA05DRAFT_391785 [Tricharina praecox]